jgi:anti-sigma factor RsiW
MTFMIWTCELTDERLSDYIDELLTPEERAAFLKHVPSCAKCAPMFTGVAHLVKNLHSIAEIDTPPRLVYAILDQTLGPRESFWQKAARLVRGMGTQKFAYGVASLAVTFTILLSASGFSFRHPKASDLNPATIYRKANSQAHVVYGKGAKFFSDLRVVNEIQSRLRENEQVPVNQEESLPQRSPGKDPGSTDGTRPGPRQQNRADGIYRNMEVLADEMPIFNFSILGGRSAR